MLEQSGAELLKCLLIVERKAQRIEISASLVFDPLTNKIDARTRRFGRSLSGQPFAHHQADGRGQRHFIAATGTADRIGAHLQDKRFIEVGGNARSEEHTSELQSLMRISYAVFCLKKTITMT